MQYGFRCTTISAVLAIRIAKEFGCTIAHMVAFDACVNGTLGYAKAIGYSTSKGGKPDRFIGHKRMIEREATLPINWVKVTTLT